MQPLNRKIDMLQLLFSPKLWITVCGIIVGWIQLALSNPALILTSGLGSTIAITLLLGFCTVIGQAAGKFLIKTFSDKWEGYFRKKK